MKQIMAHPDIDYIESGPFTEEDKRLVSEFIRNDKLKNAQQETAVKRPLPTFRRTTQRKKELA
jgi:hypothetical protein